MSDEILKGLRLKRAYTSQLCFKCGEKGNRNKGLFKCNGTKKFRCKGLQKHI